MALESVEMKCLGADMRSKGIEKNAARRQGADLRDGEKAMKGNEMQ